jgi:hypothetical protein
MAIDKVTTPAVTDDSVTLAKMAPGTDGNIISYDASGNPVAVATGSAGQVLTSAGAGAPPTFAAAGGNTPMFEAVMSANQALGNGSTTKIQFNTERFDTNGNYDHSTNYRFTPTVAGNYQFDVSVQYAAGGSNLAYCYVFIYKNGSARKISLNDFQANPGNTHNATASYIIDMDGSSDYVEAYGHMSSAGNVLYNDGGSSSSKSSVFKGYKLIG